LPPETFVLLATLLDSYQSILSIQKTPTSKDINGEDIQASLELSLATDSIV